MLAAATAKVAAARRFGRKLSVLITDIEWFNKVNDTYGSRGPIATRDAQCMTNIGEAKAFVE